MRSHYNDFAAIETNKMSSTNGNNNSNNGAIPYHARENSLPFSYGQISKTSTPLRPTTSSSPQSRNYKNGVENEFDFDFDFGLSSTGRNVGGFGYGYGKASSKSSLNGSGRDVNYNTSTQQNTSDRANNRNNFCGGGSETYLNNNNNKCCTQSVRYNNKTTTSSTDETDASMIKAQPRLTSPLLVRKTLSNGNSNNNSNHIRDSISPTRTKTNTIANTYHYSYGNASNNNSNIGSNIGDNFDKFGVNGNINNNDNYGHKTMYGGGDILTATKTPARHDFDELLRERREKVFSEYRSTTHDLTSPKASPLPPPRRFANGTVQLPSTLPPSLSSNKSSCPPQIPNRSQSQNSKYNYDFQFNLNLNDRFPDNEDEVDNVNILRRRANTIDRSPQRKPQYQKQQQQQYQQEQQQQQLYQTRDIPLSSSYVERNYHTISSSSSSATHTKNDNNISNNHNYYRENSSPTSMLAIYSKPYDERSKRYDVQPLEAISTSATASTLQRTKRSDYSTYGNDSMYGHEHTNIGQTMADRESSPIYAMSTKKATTTNTTLYRSNNAATSPLSTATSTTTLTAVTDYPSPASARPETPAFPVTPRTPFSGSSIISNGYNSQTATLNTRNVSYQQQQQQQQQQNTVAAEQHNYSTETIYGTNYRPRLNSSLSTANSEPQEVAAHLVKFAKDSSKFWYKPNLSREEAISLLINAAPGTFVVRDSTTYKNAYGLVLRVSQAPPGSASTGKPDDLVRHFLIEPTTRGVRLKGCANEPVFTSLSALVFQHSLNQLALPCLLQIPERDIVPPLVEHTPAQKQLLTQGAACNVLWIFSCDTESLTGEEAIRKAIRQMYAESSTPLDPTEVHFKVTQQGITLTDNTRKKFFRKHYTADIISYCAIDPDHRLWTMQEHGNDNTTVVGALKKTIFAFVARRSASSKDNQCHVFCDLAINQPASAIVSFVNKTLPTEKQKNYVL